MLTGPSHVSVINWVKQAADEIRKKRNFNNKKTNILELDEMCINFTLHVSGCDPRSGCWLDDPSFYREV